MRVMPSQYARTDATIRPRPTPRETPQTSRAPQLRDSESRYGARLFALMSSIRG